MRSKLEFQPVVLCVFRNYMNDSLRTNVFVRFQPETIACACIYLAARALQVSPGCTGLCPSLLLFFQGNSWKYFSKTWHEISIKLLPV